MCGGGGGGGRHEDEFSVYLLLETTTVSMFILIIFNLHNLIQSKCTVSNHWLVNLHAGVAVGSMPLGNFRFATAMKSSTTTRCFPINY